MLSLGKSSLIRNATKTGKAWHSFPLRLCLGGVNSSLPPYTRGSQGVKEGGRVFLRNLWGHMSGLALLFITQLYYL